MLKLIIFTSNNKDLEILLNFKQKSMHVIIHSFITGSISSCWWSLCTYLAQMHTDSTREWQDYIMKRQTITCMYIPSSSESINTSINQHLHFETWGNFLEEKKNKIINCQSWGQFLPFQWNVHEVRIETVSRIWPLLWFVYKSS